MQWYIFKAHFSGKLMCSCFLSSTNRPYLSMACTYTEIFNNLFFRFFRNLCNILHECDSSATPENPGTNEGVAVILYHQNHDFGKYFCKLYISKHYLWWVSNAIFFFCLFLSASGSQPFTIMFFFLFQNWHFVIFGQSQIFYP